MKKIFKYLISGMLVCFSMGLSACIDVGKLRESGTQSEKEQTESVREEGIINGFETVEDLYATRFNMLDSTFTDNYKATINKDKAYVKTGDGSVKFEYHHSATNPGFLFYGENIKGLDMLNLKQASLQMYNGCEHEIIVFFHLHRKDGNTVKSSPMYTETFTLTPNAWTELVLPINNVVMQYNGNNVFGFGVEFKLSPSTHSGEDERPCILYMDDFAIEYGVTLTQEDEEAKAQIDQIIEKFAALPSTITVDSEEVILEAYELYTNLPDKYKGAVTNYELYTTAVNKFVSELNKTSTEEETTVIFMDKFIGSSQFRESPTFDEMATLGYTMDEKFGDEVGSTYIQFYGEEETKADGAAYAGWFWSTSAVLSDYDYVEFAVKNATDKQITFWWTWGGTTQINPSDEWQVLTYPVEVFATDVKEFECVPSDHVGPTGRLYFSAIKAYAGRVEGLTDPALVENGYEIGGAATTTAVQSGTKVVATADGDITVSINKTLDTLTMGENAYLNVCAAKARKLVALNEAGETLYSISLEAGWNTLIFTANTNGGYTLNGVTAFKMEDAERGEELIFGDFLLARPSNDNAVRVLMQSKYVDRTNVYALAQYLSAYDGLTKSELNRLEMEYTTAKLDAVEWKKDLNTTFVSLIQTTYEAFDATQARRIKLVYEIYQGLTGVTPLTAEDNEKAQSIIEEWKLLPQTLWSPDNADDVAMFSVETRPGDKYANTMSVTLKATFVTEIDPIYGTVLKIVDSEHYMATLRINYQYGLSNSTGYWTNKLAGFDKVVFHVYNPSTDGVRFMISNSNGGLHATSGDSGSWVTLRNGWNEIVVDASKWIDATGFPSETAYYMYFNGKNDSNVSGVQFKISQMVGYTEAGYEKYLADIQAEKLAKAQKAIQLINELPSVETLVYQTAAINTKVAQIQEAYTLIGMDITNWDKFEAFYSEYQKLPALLLDANATNFTSDEVTDDATSGHVNFSGMISTFTNQTDDTYGNVVQAEVTAHNWTAIGYVNFNAGMTSEEAVAYWSKQLEGLDKIVFYVYNGYSTDLNIGIRKGNLESITSNTLCAAGEWTMVTIDVDTLLNAISSGSAPYLAFADNNNPSLKGATFKFTSFVGYTDAQYAETFGENN